MIDSGVYRIVNSQTGTTYIGSSCEIKRRLLRHRRELSRGIHQNSYLQRAWNKYGSAFFAFEQLVQCEKTMLATREQGFMDAYREHGLPLFNLRPSTESRTSMKTELSQSIKNKISAANTGRVFTEEHKEKLRAAKIGRAQTPEHVEHARVTRIGKHHSHEWCAAISNAALARWAKIRSLDHHATSCA